MKALAKFVFIPLLLALLIAIPAAFAQEGEPAFSQAELDQMLAPIALYPDALLSQILMAATYPLEVVEASRWSKDNPGLEGEKAVEAVADRDWDPSVKALVAFPQILARMDADLAWTKRLGDAFLFQEAQVMDTVQGLRERASAAGHLDALEHVRVQRDRDVIIVEPAHPQIVYVPDYHPRVIYGTWWWPAYPPIYWGPPPGHYASTVFSWGRGIHVSSGFFFSTCDWRRRHIVIVNVHKHPHTSRFRSRRHHVRHDGFHTWRHDPKHRRGVAYRHETLHREYGRSRASAGGEQQGGWRRHPESHNGRDHISRSQRTRSSSRTDDRRAGSAAHIRGRNSTRSGADETRNVPRPATPSNRRSDTVRSNADRPETRGYHRDSDTRGAGLHRRPAQRSDAVESTTRRFNGGQTPSRRPDVNRPTRQQQGAVRGMGVENARAARTENRLSSGDRRTNRESWRSASPSWSRGNSRAASDRRQGVRGGGRSMRSPAATRRGGAFSR
jgi:Protein of unknown function (DUF3300)